ncbi:MAG: RecQ family ATP-dependent DNA helicase [Saprospiraceae bacterium]|nr:RecQ family ATP-dependent DNA helicase [Saprospiraceae bacterium]
MYTLEKSLKEYFGFDTFKGDQKPIIESVLAGKDTFVIMPTGGGKSLCYQLPALLLPGTALIISPLIALMKNQVDSIRGYSQSDELAAFLNSSLTRTQMREVKEGITNGTTKMLFVAPETLTKDENIEFFQQTNISFVAIDEAHCISEWGHDFRPEYRRIRTMITAIGADIPLVALTATATPKVQTDIVKNLNMKDVNIFISSFNRDNLYYEIRPKLNREQTVKEIVQFIKSISGKSGIIYVQARKTTEELAKVLSVNGIKASPYHAGLDAKVRTKVQDDFLMEEIEVIVATIAFGMGIDKPDVRFVIHYDIPKSIENYYQETGRGGRDGLEGRCLAFYSYKDILKLEKFLRDKPVSERELGAQLMDEIIAYSETGACRRKFLLHYFGEPYDETKCDKMCDNCRHPKDKIEVKKELSMAIKAIKEINESFLIKTVIEFITGKATKEMKDFRFDKLPSFGVGKDYEDLFWHSIIRHGILNNLIEKDIELYGLLKITDDGNKFLAKPWSVSIPLNRDFSEAEGDDVSMGEGAAAVLDEVLVKHLIEIRKKEARKYNVQPWIIFQEPSLQDMATFYPVSMEDMLKITGVNQGKAAKYARPFIDFIRQYVEENEIERPDEILIRQVANKSKDKVTIIQGIDKKLPLEDIARNVGKTMEELLEELNFIVDNGTKLDLDYYIEEEVDQEIVDEIFEYYQEADSASLMDAYKALKDEDITIEELSLVRIKFMSEYAN